MSVVSDAFHSLVREIKSFAVDLFTLFCQAGIDTLRKAGPVLLTAATDAVQAAEAKGGTSSEKFQAAYDAAVADLKSKGLPIVESEVKLAIENAVQNMKASQPATAAQ